MSLTHYEDKYLHTFFVPGKNCEQKRIPYDRNRIYNYDKYFHCYKYRYTASKSTKIAICSVGSILGCRSVARCYSTVSYYVKLVILISTPTRVILTYRLYRVYDINVQNMFNQTLYFDVNTCIHKKHYFLSDRISAVVRKCWKQF